MEQAGYYEPSAAFPLLLHIVAWPLNKLISCGLLGQIVVGMIFGEPLTEWLGDGSYTTVLQLGYIGLILLVYEGITDSLGFGRDVLERFFWVFGLIFRRPGDEFKFLETGFCA